MKAFLIDSNQKSYSYLMDAEGVISSQFPPFSEWLSQDAIISDFILSQIDTQTEIDLFIIPFSVTENYLEFSGIRLAHHLRLSSKYFKKPILFIGDLSPIAIYKLTPLSNILSTEGVYCINTSKTVVEHYLQKNHFIELENIEQYLSRVTINPPANYESHHSIDNELALLQWSEYIKCDNDIPEVKQNLQTGLYFKYMKALNPIKPFEIGTLNKIEGDAKILLIDDEAGKGWYHFYESFFKLSPQIRLDNLSIDYKSLSRNEIIAEATKKIIGFDPDLVLLDLRLCDEDFNTNAKLSPQDLTGYQILKVIKGFNKGIQVVITTASNKAWSYQSTISEGANGYVIKAGNSDVHESIGNLKRTIEEGVNKSQFLKSIARDFLKLTNCVELSMLFSIRYKESVKNNLEIAFKLLEEYFNIPKYINYSYLQLFLIVEEFLKEESVFYEGDNSYVIHEDKEYLVLKLIDGKDKFIGFDSAITFTNGYHYIVQKGYYDKRYIDTNFKMSAVLLFKYGLTTSGAKNWTKICKVRNQKAAHPEVEIVGIEEYEKLVIFLLFILSNSNFNPIALEKALTPPNLEEQIKNLKDKMGL